MYPVVCKVKCCKKMVPRSQMKKYTRKFSEKQLLMLEESNQSRFSGLEEAHQASISHLRTSYTVAFTRTTAAVNH
jgi:Mg2+/Co2+ transporter CorC